MFLHVFTETRLRRCVEERRSGDHCERPGQSNHSVLCGFHRHRATYWWCRQESGGAQSWEHRHLFDNVWQVSLGNYNVKINLEQCTAVNVGDGDGDDNNDGGGGDGDGDGGGGAAAAAASAAADEDADEDDEGDDDDDADDDDDDDDDGGDDDDDWLMMMMKMVMMMMMLVMMMMLLLMTMTMTMTVMMMMMMMIVIVMGHCKFCMSRPIFCLLWKNVGVAEWSSLVCMSVSFLTAAWLSQETGWTISQNESFTFRCWELSVSHPKVFDAKRLIGRKFADPIVQADIKLWPFKCVAGQGDKPMIIVNAQGEARRRPTKTDKTSCLMRCTWCFDI